MSGSDDSAFVDRLATVVGSSASQRAKDKLVNRLKGENRPFSQRVENESKAVLEDRAAANGQLPIWKAAYSRLAQDPILRNNATVLLSKIAQNQDMLASLSSGERTENRGSAANQMQAAPTMDKRMLHQQTRGTPPPAAGRNISIPHRYLEGDDSVIESHSELNSLELNSPLETVPRASPMVQQSTPFTGVFEAQMNPMFTTHNSAMGSPGMDTVYNTAEEPNVEVEATITLPDAGNLFTRMYEVVRDSAPEHIIEKLSHRPSYDGQLYLPYSMNDDIFFEEPPKLSLSGLHIRMQDLILTEDIIKAFQGGSTSVLELAAVRNEAGNTHYVYTMSAQNSRACDSSLCEQLQELLQIPQCVLLLERYITSRFRPEFGAVCGAFANAVRLLLADWGYYVCTLEKELMRSEEWTLIRVKTYSLSRIGPLIATAKICAEASAQRAYGASLLNLLHRHSLSVSGNEQIVQTIRALLKAASVPYFENLTTWVSTGTLNDPFSEFMVVAVPGMNVDMELDGQSAYWVGGHKLRTVEVDGQEETDVPGFLHDVADAVLKAGKNWNILRQCQQQAASTGGGFDELIPAVVPQPVQFDSQGVFKKQIQQHYECASASLLKMMLSHFRLKDWLASCKKFFLLHQADYLINFLDSAESELYKEVNVASMGLLRGQLEMAVRSSSLAHDPFSDKLQFVLDPNSFTDLHTVLVQALFHRKTNTKKQAKNIEKMKAADLIMLELDVPWPVSIVLTPHIMRAFQFCFRHLVNVKVVERKLGEKWSQLMDLRSLKRPKNDAERKGQELLWRLLALVTRMNTFIRRYLHFLTVEVIDPHWHEMNTKIDQALSIDEVIVLLRECLHKILEVGLLERLKTLSVVVMVYWKCRNFCMKVDEAIKAYEKHHHTDSSPEQQGKSLTPDMWLKVAMQPGFESFLSDFERKFAEAQGRLSAELKAHKYSAGVNGVSVDSVADACKLLHQILEAA